MNEISSRNATILQVEDLKKYFPIRRGFFQRIASWVRAVENFQRIASWVRAVENVSFMIKGGKTLGLVGESGCGKTTVARLILKLLAADAGKIIFDGQDITDLNEAEMKPLRNTAL
jgi:ABC-type oligopeptide transport system ATPase subunit